MQISKKLIESELIKLHKKYSGRRISNKESQVCSLWSTDYPPDVLQCTPQLDEIEAYVDFGFEEMEAITFYDMSIEDAASYIFDIIENCG